MPPQETPPEADSTGQSEPTFLDHLFQILLFEQYGGENPAIDNRERLLDILALNSEYLRRSGADADYAARNKLAFFMAELCDLDDGVQSPIFEARKLGYGAPDSSVIWRSRTTLAIAFDFLRKAGVSEADALKTISETPGIEKILSKGADAKKAPRNWRATLHAGVTKNALAREQWDQSRKVIDGLTGSPSDKQKFLEAEAKRLIAAAVEDIKEI
jgi:hypothetical protein